MLSFLEKEKLVVPLFVKYPEVDDVIFLYMFSVAGEYISMIMWARSIYVGNSAYTWDLWSNSESAKFVPGCLDIEGSSVSDTLGQWPLHFRVNVGGSC